MADDSKMTSLADLIKSISEGKGFKGKSMDPGFIMKMPDPYEGMSEEEKEMRKKFDKIMTERFTVDPFEGMSEEEIKKIKERNKRWREHLERARERMGLPESIQLLNQGGIMDVNTMTAPLGYKNGGETQVAMSDPNPMAELEDMYDNMIKDGTYKGTWEDFLLDIQEVAKGGMVGYANGGPAGMTELEMLKSQMAGSEGPRVPTQSEEKALGMMGPVPGQPWENLKNVGRGVRDKAKTGIATLKKLGLGAMDIGQELLGAGPAEAGTFSDDLDIEIIKLESAIQALQLEELFGGSDNSRAITSKQNLLDYYKSLK